jgi:hypothetical protein
MVTLVLAIVLVISGALGIAKVISLLVLSIIAAVAGVVLIFAHLGWLGTRV